MNGAHDMSDSMIKRWYTALPTKVICSLCLSLSLSFGMHANFCTFFNFSMYSDIDEIILMESFLALKENFHIY